jgi:hypothetical protein
MRAATEVHGPTRPTLIRGFQGHNHRFSIEHIRVSLDNRFLRSEKLGKQPVALYTACLGRDPPRLIDLNAYDCDGSLHCPRKYLGMILDIIRAKQALQYKSSIIRLGE